MGRPKRILSEKEQKLIVALYQTGKTDQEVADVLGMSRTTFLYALKSNALVDTIKNAKQIPDRKVEKSLFKRAIGYQYIERKRERRGVRLITTVTKKEVPGDVTACIFWLCNRVPDRWQNKQQIKHEGELVKQIIIMGGKMEDKLGKRLGEIEGPA